jgi:hypothetical protein
MRAITALVFAIGLGAATASLRRLQKDLAANAATPEILMGKLPGGDDQLRP